MRKIIFAVSLLFVGFILVGCQATNSNETLLSTTDQTFTVEELAQYDGLNGHLGYIAVSGIVYDVTDVFVNGDHQGIHLAGKDCTDVFALSPHSQALLDTLTVVGTLVDATQTTDQTTSTDNTTTTNTTDTYLPVFTLTELSEYTGANGSTAYIAVNGVIYDVTSAFVNGTHQGLQLGGTDATSVFASSPHSQATLNSLPVVGSLEGYPQILNPNQTNTNTTTTTTLPVFTLTELSQYTGANGSTAYIAVNGVIYDVTSAFVNGTHQGLQLGGTDATAVFASSPHSQATLDSLTIVGSLEGYPLIDSTQTNTTTQTTDCDDDDDDHDDDDHDDDDHDDDEYEDD